MKIAGKRVGNIGYNRAELTQAYLTRGRVDPHSALPHHWETYIFYLAVHRK